MGLLFSRGAIKTKYTVSLGTKLRDCQGRGTSELTRGHEKPSRLEIGVDLGDILVIL